MLANLPLFYVDLILYEGYLSVPIIVLDTNTRGYHLEHFPSIMNGELDSVYRKAHVSYFLSQLHAIPSGILAHIT